MLGDKITKADAGILKTQGNEVEELVVYKNLQRRINPDTIRKLTQIAPQSLAFLFYSPSAVENLHSDLNVSAELFNQSVFLAIGATTASAIRDRFKVEPLVADSPKEESLLNLLRNL